MSAGNGSNFSLLFCACSVEKRKNNFVGYFCNFPTDIIAPGDQNFFCGERHDHNILQLCTKNCVPFSHDRSTAHNICNVA